MADEPPEQRASQSRCPPGIGDGDGECAHGGFLVINYVPGLTDHDLVTVIAAVEQRLPDRRKHVVNRLVDVGATAGHIFGAVTWLRLQLLRDAGSSLSAGGHR